MEARIQASVKLGKPKLLDQVRTVLRLQHYSRRTEEGYVDWIRRFFFLTAQLTTEATRGC